MRHKGEEFFIVPSGRIELHSEFYNPVKLDMGDSVHLDSQMGHALISVSKINRT